MDVLLGEEGDAEAREGRRVVRAGKDAVDGDVLLLEKEGRHGAAPVDNASLGRAVLGEGRARVDANHAARDNDLSARRRVMPHKVRCESGAKDDGLEVDVGASQVRLGRQVCDGAGPAGKVVDGAPVDEARVGDEGVDARPLLPDGLEELRLRVVRGDVALDEGDGLARGIQLLGDGLALFDAAARDDDAVALREQVLGEVVAYPALWFTDTGLASFVCHGAGSALRVRVVD